MRTQFPTKSKPQDRVYTPDWCAADVVQHFRPRGRILEPCRGEGAFAKALPPGTDWCEIEEGRDFFDWSDPVDWIVTNPPYSTLRAFFLHAIVVAENVVFLMPARSYFSAFGFVNSVRQWGGLREIRWYGTGTRLGFPMGNAIAALHWQKGHSGFILETFSLGDWNFGQQPTLKKQQGT